MKKQMKIKYTFWELLNNYHIEIPKIQRDYAQGREDKEIVKIADKFLKDLHNSIINSKQLNLDFVYGKVENDILIPLDGQQRLTTLFLIHWYLAVKENRLKNEIKHNLLNFTYEIRLSSQDFCKKLVEENIDYASITENVSNTIMDSKWYFLSWKQDPTVSSMLNILDKIHNEFKNDEDVFDKLISKEIVTFQFLSLEEFKLTDELYIKMNARGLPLTEFENFKANFSGYLNTIENKSKLDNQWLDIFWEKEKKENGEIATKEIDKKFFDFFKNITLNFYAEVNEIDRAFMDNYDLFENYNKIYSNDFNVNCLVNILDALTSYNDSENIFRDFTSDNINYWQRLRFYSLSHFFIKYGKVTDDNEIFYKRWLRVNNNLINNTLIQSPENYRDAICSINELSKNIEDIYRYISSSADTITYFLGLQRTEESLKAKLIINDEKWEEILTRVEKHSYFDGQIGFVLEYSKNINGDYDIDLFNSYSSKLSKLFSSEFEENYNFLFQRALFTKGNYLIDIGQNKTFCVFDEALRTKMDNWRKVFNDDVNTLYIKQLLEDINENNIKDGLEKIINNNTITDWRKIFIDDPDHIYHCHKRLLRFYSNKIYLLSKTQMNGKHKELHSLDLYKRKYHGKYYTPFSEQIRYLDSISSDEPIIIIGGFEYETQKHDLTIEYFRNDKYYLKFSYRKYWGYSNWYYSSEIHDDLSEILRKLSFENNKILLAEDELELKIQHLSEELENINK